MTNREFEALTNQYKREIEFGIAMGTLNRNKDGNFKKSILVGRDINTGKPIRIQAEAKTVEG